MLDTSVRLGTVEVFEAQPPHPVLTWEPGNVDMPLRISTTRDDAGHLAIWIDTARTVTLADDVPPFEIYVDDTRVYGDLPGPATSSYPDPRHITAVRPRPVNPRQPPAPAGDQDGACGAVAAGRPTALGARR